MVYAGSEAIDCNSYWAQGGIIYRGNDGDSAESLVKDIVRAGAGLSDRDAAWKLASQGPDRVRQLLLDHEKTRCFANVPFDRTPQGELSLCLEASHAAPRILHHADHTGKTITEHMVQAVAKHPLITCLPNTLVTDLIVQDDVCVGVQTYNNQSISNEYASFGTVLCSGGLAGIYLHSTNPTNGFNALGSSVAIAKRANVELRDLEYVQFHPTALALPPVFLLSEALRGEGALLRNEQGRAFAKDFSPDGELAPRDVVARGVYAASQSSRVYLDISHRDADWLRGRFPSIHAHLMGRGLDFTKEPIPITPAAHYTCGGVATDLEGKTSLTNLYAAGEAARTGLHGGNRLASTSLLEGLVFGAAVADHVGKRNAVCVSTQEPSPQQPQQQYKHNRSKEYYTNALTRVRSIMWDGVGVARTTLGLQTAKEQLQEIQDVLWDDVSCAEAIAVRDAVTAGLAVTDAALSNKTSVGAHYMVDDDDMQDQDHATTLA